MGTVQFAVSGSLDTLQGNHHPRVNLHESSVHNTLAGSLQQEAEKSLLALLKASEFIQVQTQHYYLIPFPCSHIQSSDLVTSIFHNISWIHLFYHICAPHLQSSLYYVQKKLCTSVLICYLKISAQQKTNRQKKVVAVSFSRDQDKARVGWGEMPLLIHRSWRITGNSQSLVPIAKGKMLGSGQNESGVDGTERGGWILSGLHGPIQELTWVVKAQILKWDCPSEPSLAFNFPGNSFESLKGHTS